MKSATAHKVRPFRVQEERAQCTWEGETGLPNLMSGIKTFDTSSLQKIFPEEYSVDGQTQELKNGPCPYLTG